MKFSMTITWVISFIIIALRGCRGELHSVDQVSVLLKFKTGINHDPAGSISGSWIQGTTDPGGCPSSWYGIVCDNGNIAEIVLDNLNLSLTADHLCIFTSLSNLSKLSLAGNLISGTIPACVTDIGVSLNYLDLSQNLLSSSIPPQIENFTSLTHLSLSQNNLSGTIPGSFSRLSGILSLDLSGNSFTGRLPSSLTHLTNLVYLNLSMNAFTGEIPTGFERIQGLRILDIHGNKLSGSLDSNLLRLHSVVHVDLSSNSLTDFGPAGFPPGITESLRHLNLSHNNLEGSLLSGMGLEYLQSLKVLDLSFNLLSGELPGFYFAYELEVLRLNNNNFSGSIPNSILKGSPFILSELDLSSNGLSGNVRMISSFTLLSVNLSRNTFSGDLPLLAGSCSILDLSNNYFAGNLREIERWNSLQWLDLSRNALTGPIPMVNSVFFRLSYLDLSSNYLSGIIPFSPHDYPMLRILYLSSNLFNGSFPADILSLPSLQDLRAANNTFGGSLVIPDPPDGDPRLRVLDISLNRFNGRFPFTSGLFSSLYSLNISGNGFSGSIPGSLAQMTALVLMDISHNRLTGNLPSGFPPGVRTLDLSFNGFDGTIPVPFRHFPKSCFRPGNDGLVFPLITPLSSAEIPAQKRAAAVLKAVAISCSAFVLFILLLAAFLLRYFVVLRRGLQGESMDRKTPQNTFETSGRISSSAIAVSSGSGDKMGPGFPSPKETRVVWSPESADSIASDGFARAVQMSPDDRLAGELLFMDERIRFTPDELSSAPAEVLGRGGHGTSYRAVLNDGAVLTVKWLREGRVKSAKGFMSEAKKLGSIRHPNVVWVRACYWGPARHEKLLLSDYIWPGSLDSFLFGVQRGSLGWAKRVKISVDVARGLSHLHLDRSIPHGNLKAKNVQLDGPDLTARVSDYGLHRLVNDHYRVIDSENLGYQQTAASTSKKPGPSFKSDLYSFGVLLLEIVTGKRCRDVVFSGEAAGVGLTEWVHRSVADGQGLDCVEAVMNDEKADPEMVRSMLLVLRLALRCVLSIAERPCIKTVYDDLSNVCSEFHLC